MTESTIFTPDPEAYEMPEKETYHDFVKVLPEYIRRGDTVRKGRSKGPGGEPTFTEHVVHNKKVGTKWVYLTDADDKLIAELPVGVEVEVERELETPESSDARKRVYNNQKLAEKIVTKRAELKAAQRLFNEHMDTGYEPSYSRWSDLMRAEAEQWVWNGFAVAAENWDEGDLVDLANKQAEQMTRELIGTHAHRALSKSTSIMSNLLDEVRRESMAHFIEDVRYM